MESPIGPTGGGYLGRQVVSTRSAGARRAFLSALAIPFGFYSRFAPQLWLGPIPALMTDDLSGRFSRLPGLILAGNVALVAAASLGTQVFLERLHREQLITLANDASGRTVTYAFTDLPYPNVDRHLDAYHVRYRQVDSLACEHPAKLLKTHAWACVDAYQSPAAAADHERRAAALLAPLRR